MIYHDYSAILRVQDIRKIFKIFLRQQFQKLGDTRGVQGSTRMARMTDTTLRGGYPLPDFEATTPG